MLALRSRLFAKPGQARRASSRQAARAAQLAPLHKFAKRGDMKRVLSVDGGGLRAIIPAYLCLELEGIIRQAIVDHGIADTDGQTFQSAEDFRIRLSDFFDVFSGTSGGGLVSLFLGTTGDAATQRWLDTDPDLVAAGQELPELASRPAGSAAALSAIFVGKGAKIFSTSWGGRIGSNGLLGYGGYLRPKYNTDGLGAAVQPAIGKDSMMSNSLATSVLIPAWELRGNRPYFFYHRATTKETGFAALPRTMTAAERPPNKRDAIVFTPGLDYPTWQVARATSAAPTYFPAGRVDFTGAGLTGDDSVRYFADGGVFLNNPCTGAVAFAASTFETTPDKIAVLTMGCGASVTQPAMSPNAGALEWLTKGGLISTLMEGPSDTDAALGDYLLHHSYANEGADQLFRLQYVAFALDSPEEGAQEGNAPLASGRLPADVLSPMDNPNYYRDYIELAKRLLDENASWGSGTRRQRLRKWVEEYVLPQPSNGASNGAGARSKQLAGAR